MTIRIITASAGSGKTYRLSQELDAAIAAGRVRPDAIVATTFTRQAAAELIERARARLLDSGRGRDAHQLLAARIGTVNAVCGTFVTDFAFELGLSPSLRVLDETAAELELKRALASVVDSDRNDELQSFKYRFDDNLDWRHEVRKLIEAARANALGPDALRACAARSIASLDDCLGPCEPDGDAIDRALEGAIDAATAAIEPLGDATKTTAGYLDLLAQARRQLARQRLRWGGWAKLAKATAGKKSGANAAAEPVRQTAARHLAHPRLRAELHRFIDLLFQVAAEGLAAYQAHKRERGVIDFVDQETLALQLLRRADVRDALTGQLDLVLVDEFQDTSPLQLAIFLELSRIARESIWVGDPKQAIYGFRGTDPALMDAAIESLTGTHQDPELLRAALAAVAEHGPIGILEPPLETSYRSRPELVALTSDIFAPAFVHQNIPAERTRLRPARADEPAGLGPIVEHWPLQPPKPVSNAKLADCLATGIRDLLARAPRIRAGADTTRPATPGDLAILCRTNAQCQAVADALAALDIPAVVPQMSLLDTAEGTLARAALALWLDPRDALAAATIARLLTHPGDLDAFLAQALATPGRAAFATDPTVAALLTARDAQPDLGPLATLDAVVDVTDLRRHCAAWGNTSQRLANLDALRAHAVAYLAEAAAGSDPATLAGLLAHLDETTTSSGFYGTRTDRQALLGGEDAVTLSTWHRAKGLEWPITVLFGLETVRAPDPYGVRLMTDADTIDLADPLAGRWLRFWPNPYTTGNQGGPVRTAYESHPTFADIQTRADREALRVLYVGWTRARDRLIFAAQEKKLLAGLLGKLAALDPLLITEPTGPQVTWATRPLTVPIHPAAPSAPTPRPPRPGLTFAPRPRPAHPPARLQPSAAPPIACEVAEVVQLGPPLPFRGHVPADQLGQAVHAFLAADREHLPQSARVALATHLLTRWGALAALAPEPLLAAADSFRAFLARRWPRARLHRELPLTHRLPTGPLVTGTADLVLDTGTTFILIDHKTLAGDPTAAPAEQAAPYTGQLATYAAALTAATPRPVEPWLHIPAAGTALRLSLPGK